ncbi:MULTISPECIES: hypothetical protein [Streptomyces]|uniref:hypothetical protein n=1 Tax=Streptomyces TaxID=1883 RepID=UPI0033EEB6EF
MPNEWETGAMPWLRRHQPETTFTNEPNPVRCMFCGADSIKRSQMDRSEDTGRIELYCDNGLCEAREIVLLVKRDGAGAGSRADVRALNLIDKGILDVHATFPRQSESYTFVAGLAAESRAVPERRMRKPE